MAELTPEGQRVVTEAAARHGLSTDAVQSVLEALVASGGSMAQFNHADLGGMGQWSSGGMIMIGDMFNNGLKSRVAALCQDLSAIIGRPGIVVPGLRSSQWQSQGGAGGMQAADNSLPESSLFVSAAPAAGSNSMWWPAELGHPASTGAQNAMRYACFPERRRLALEVSGQLSVYDTGDHRITGFAQQQRADQSLTFTSQHGTVRLDSLARVEGHAVAQAAARPVPNAPHPGTSDAAAFGAGESRMIPPAGPAAQSSAQTSAPGGDIFTSIERLGALRDKGLITDDEFAAKKAELLRRL
ncbi:MAG: SHOCT domain-containing protein [Proteobacteria bacterium]|nr:SHOCT domain-containing protein [Pseudomonadota bacterium]